MKRMTLVLAMMICFTMNTKAETNVKPKTVEATKIEATHSIEKSQSKIAKAVSSLAMWNKISTIAVIVSVSFTIILNLALLLAKGS